VPGRAPAWQRRWRRHRRALAAVLAGIVVWSLASDLRPPEPATRSVATASHDLAPGTTLTTGDLVVAARRADAVADDAVPDVALVTGRVVAFPVRAGEQLRERDVVGRELLDALGPDVVATPVRLSDDATLASVRPGDLVDVIGARATDGSDPARAVVVASRVRVLTVGAPGAAGGSGILGGGGAATAPVLLLATTSEQSLAIAAAVVGARLSVTLRAG
jgi:Flp pilus assembly protein CpaB